jgi:hypothetical protein|tara:strand:+ start:1149 stop:1388 length:240 start_codon:yes stop_codon:yes gene_type:complete
MKVPIKDHDGWYKDEKSGAIQCADQKKYETYMKQYRASQEKEKAVSTLQNEVSELKSELGDIKSLLLTLVQNQSKHHDD